MMATSSQSFFIGEFLCVGGNGIGVIGPVEGEDDSRF